MHSTPSFPLGIFTFAGQGPEKPVLVHVPLRVVEDLDADTVTERHVAAPEGVTGTLVAAPGLVEV